jgi:REP element-mobilizing transposase RayT
MPTDLKERKPNRWKGFDYSSENAYFITICVDKQSCLLGKIVNKKMQLNEYGKIVEQCWNDLPNHYLNCVLDAFIVMPNHIHGIIVIDNSVFKSASAIENDLKPFPTNTPPNDNVGNGLKPFPNKKHGLSEMVRALKTFSSRRINETISIIGNGFKPFPTDIPLYHNVGNGLKLFPTEVPLPFKWQKSFHDHIIRDFKALENIRNYIITNPANWEKDVFFMNINYTL